MKQDGTHRHGAIFNDSKNEKQLNSPKERECFFCLKSKPTTLIELYPNQIDILKRSGNPIKILVADKMAKMRFACCKSCKTNTKLIADSIFDYYKVLCMLEMTGK